ncbi:MAG: BON domain-containing protein [Rhodothermales bacterium]|nr:BON domain-containing protein [Rhodothermales bacterium]
MTFASPMFSRFTLPFARLFSSAPTDRRIAGYLAELFESEMDHTAAEGLRFYVKRGIVTLHGTLYDAMDRDHVIQLTARIPGLDAIVDRLHIVDDVHHEALNARVVLLLNGTHAPTHLLPA